jgi:hypothetical protein
MKQNPIETHAMTIEQLRSYHQARPFRAFTIYTADGRSCPVPCPEWLSYSPTGRTIIVHHPDDTHTMLDLLLVTEPKVDPPRTSQAGLTG